MQGDRIEGLPKLYKFLQKLQRHGAFHAANLACRYGVSLLSRCTELRSFFFAQKRSLILSLGRSRSLVKVQRPAAAL